MPGGEEINWGEKGKIECVARHRRFKQTRRGQETVRKRGEKGGGSPRPLNRKEPIFRGWIEPRTGTQRGKTKPSIWGRDFAPSMADGEKRGRDVVAGKRTGGVVRRAFLGTQGGVIKNKKTRGKKRGVNRTTRESENFERPQPRGKEA